MSRIEKGEVLSEDDETEEEYASNVRDGVEVVDVKVVPKGIPEKGNRVTWDKI